MNPGVKAKHRKRTEEKGRRHEAFGVSDWRGRMKPSKPGLYWFCTESHDKPSLVNVINSDDGLQMEYFGINNCTEILVYNYVSETEGRFWGKRVAQARAWTQKGEKA